KLWVGIGVATIAGAASMSAETGAQVPGHEADGKAHGAHAASPPSQNAAGAAQTAADDGEAYLTDGGPTDTRIRFYRDLELMRGHLLVGGELLDLGLWDEALPHFLHPVEELYGLL